MKASLRQLLIVAFCISTATSAKLNDDLIIDDEVEPQQTQPSAPVIESPFKLKGSLSNNVHILSQMSGSNPDVKFSVVFPPYFSQKESVVEMELKQGDTMRALIGLQNNHNQSIYIKSVTGAFVDEVGDIQNFA